MNRVLLFTLVAGIIGAGWCLGGGVAPVYAQINLRLSDPKVRLSIIPGTSQSGEMAIENPTEESIRVRCYLEDWVYTPEGDGGKQFYPADSTPLSCASWISFSPAEFTLQPFGRQVISYRVDVPADARGGHYAVLFLETVIGEGRDVQGLNVLILGRLGALFYVQAQGTIDKRARIDNLKISPQKEGFRISATFKNTGNVDITATGDFNLLNEEGLVFARGQFNDVYTLPQDEVPVQAGWEKQIEPGIYYLVITLDLGEKTYVEERRVRFGPRRIEVLEETFY